MFLMYLILLNVIHLLKTVEYYCESNDLGLYCIHAYIECMIQGSKT